MMPAEALAAIEAMGDRRRADFEVAIERTSSPAKMFVVASHLLSGRSDLAFLAAHMLDSEFTAHDDAIRLAYSMGRLSRG